jgi:hypothetical protein
MWGGVKFFVVVVTHSEFKRDAVCLKFRPLKVGKIGGESDRLILGDDIGTQLKLDFLKLSHLILL